MLFYLRFHSRGNKYRCLPSEVQKKNGDLFRLAIEKRAKQPKNHSRVDREAKPCWN